MDDLPEREEFAEPTLAACAAWLDIGFVGAAGLLIALLRLFDGTTPWHAALLWAAGAGAFAVACWWRGLDVLKNAAAVPSQPYFGR